MRVAALESRTVGSCGRVIVSQPLLLLAVRWVRSRNCWRRRAPGIWPPLRSSCPGRDRRAGRPPPEVPGRPGIPGAVGTALLTRSPVCSGKRKPRRRDFIGRRDRGYLSHFFTSLISLRFKSLSGVTLHTNIKVSTVQTMNISQGKR